MADYSAGTTLVDQLKLGRTLFLEAFDKANLPINLTLPLVGFAHAYDGPPQGTKVFEKVYSSREEMQADSEREKRAQEEVPSVITSAAGHSCPKLRPLTCPVLRGNRALDRACRDRRP